MWNLEMWAKIWGHYNKRDCCNKETNRYLPESKWDVFNKTLDQACLGFSNCPEPVIRTVMSLGYLMYILIKIVIIISKICLHSEYLKWNIITLETTSYSDIRLSSFMIMIGLGGVTWVLIPGSAVYSLWPWENYVHCNQTSSSIHGDSLIYFSKYYRQYL